MSKDEGRLDKNNLLELYPEYTKVLGPYKRKDGRKHVVLNNEALPSGNKGKLKTISYPKALLESLNKEKLRESETVDHIDRDYTNNSIDNLQILDKSKHGKKDAKRRINVMAPCVYCGKEFIMSRDQLTGRGKAGPFCSRSCSGKYGSDVQKGEPIMERMDIPVGHYYEN